MNTTIRNSTLYGIPAMLLVLPLVAMQFTKEVNWTVSDFVIGGILLFGTAGIIDFVLRKVKSRRNRIILSVSVLLVLMLIWAELAVGLFGTPFAGS
ncbi:hypothetical protein [Kaistella pullorum]|uniref:Uncharacterized protein n=1 Tax=Kaistella pullorum TaxID=2763074 RepID=A0ABR8WQM8_9FLAO|nr:hypothetical protein [Kaistella pullorum]MBD8019031.1 hypothetical protein [Kaistella pullorum]